MLVTSDGVIENYPKSRITTFCSIEYEFFPFDVQVCKILVGSWSYDGTQVCIVLLHLC